MTRRQTARPCLVFLLLLLLAPRSGHADASLDVANDLRGARLGTHVSLLEDPAGTLVLEDVATGTAASRFHTVAVSALNLGFTESAYWLRFQVENTASQPRAWLLELGYPHLDHVALYVPSGASHRVRETGDMVPFAQRDLSYRNFVFTLEEPARSARTYYLRVATAGAVSLPLTAWTLNEFVAHQHLEWAGLMVFYGVILMTALYNLSLFGFTRDGEYLRFALFVLSISAFQLSYVGHTFQFLFPRHPALAQAALPVSIALCMLFSTLFGQDQLDDAVSPAHYQRTMRGLIYASLLTLLVAALTPFRFSIRVVPAAAGLAALVSCVVLRRVVRENGPKARLYVLGWSCLFGGTLVHLLKTRGVLPSNTFTEWSAQIGVSLHFVLVSAAVALKLTMLRGQLHTATGTLAQQVRALEAAVLRAEHATEQAERAARVKDEFMATMSHELRTPLNTIINVPPGLARDFPLRNFAVCAHCQTTFELDAHESLSASTRCAECACTGTLRLHEVASYTGEPARTARYLETIERSGMHLLKVVDGILRNEHKPDNDSEPDPTLAYELTHMDRVVRDVVEEMTGPAERAGLSLTLVVSPGDMELALDPLRIRQVLLNLLGNAIKFSGRGGKVAVSLDADPMGCLISVHDQGIGIAQDKLASVFDSYQQAHDDEQNYGGTGLGLAIAQKLVQSHGGSLWVDSELGRGASFHVRLPRGERQRRSG